MAICTFFVSHQSEHEVPHVDGDGTRYGGQEQGRERNHRFKSNCFKVSYHVRLAKLQYTNWETSSREEKKTLIEIAQEM